MIYHGAVGEGRLSLNRFVDVTATTPAKMFGLFPQKGTIAVGTDADIVIWDPKATHTMSVESSHMDVDYNAYEGNEVQGEIDLVMARGKVLVSDGEYHGKKGDGRFLKRGTSQLLV